MTALLQQAFARAAKLSEPEQEVLASRLLAELAGEDDLDLAMSRSSKRLAALAREAIAEQRLGKRKHWFRSAYELAHDAEILTPGHFSGSHIIVRAMSSRKME